MTFDSIYNKMLSFECNERYLKRYISFISSRKNLVKREGMESHHILPKALFPEFSSFKDNPWNKIFLTYREHYIAHLILARVYGGKMIQAFFCMSNLVNDHHTREIKRSREYKGLKEELSVYLRNTMSGAGNPNFGNKHSEETRKKISEKSKGHKRNIGRKLSDDTKSKIGQKTKERFEDEEYKNNHKKKMKESSSSEERREKSRATLNRYIEEKGHPRLGKVHSEESKQKIRDSKAKNPVRLVGERNGMYGKKWTPEMRQKILESRKRRRSISPLV